MFVLCAEEEEDEDTSALPPVEEAKEEKDEQDEQQEDGKNRNASLPDYQTTAGVGFFFELRVSLFSPPKSCVSRHSQGADRRREAAGPALGGVCVVFRARQQDRGKSSGRAGRRLLRLQRQRSGGQRRVRITTDHRRHTVIE